MKETTTGNAVAEVVPLKQGLKQPLLLMYKVFKLRCRGSSIKTRIETNMLDV